MATDDAAADSGAINICVMGAARTGTHLMNSVICQTGETTPLLPEAHPLADLAVFSRQARRYAAGYPGSLFADDAAALRAANAPLREIIGELRARYGTAKCVFRAPALSLHADELFHLFRSLGTPFRFICMLRDPRDAITSMFRWNERRVARGQKPMCGEDEDMLDFFIQRFWSQYRHLVPLKGERELLFVRYEELVESSRAVAATIYAELGLDAARFDPAARWSNVEADLDVNGAHGDCITDLYSQPVSSQSVGAFRDFLDGDQEKRVFTRLAQYRKAFYPELALSTH